MRMAIAIGTGNWSIHGVGPYPVIRSTVGAGGREIEGKWESCSRIISQTAYLGIVRQRG